MARSPDFLSPALKTCLAPFLRERGFFANGSRQFLRLRGDLVDSIWFQVSVWGGKGFYVHHLVSSLVNPSFSIHDSRVGERTDKDPTTGLRWDAADKASADKAVAEVLAHVRSTVLPWLDGISSLNDYIVHYIANPNSSIDDLELASALAALGHKYRAFWICRALTDNQNETDAVRSSAAHLLDAINSDSVVAYLQKIREKNILSHKLVPRQTER